MVAYSFKAQFVEPIRAGLGLATYDHIRPKRQTVRADRKRHARPGEELQLYRGMRTKQCFLIGRAECLTTLPIRLDFKGERIFVGPGRIDGPKLDGFANADGFDDWAALRQFWRDNHDGVAIFDGVIIKWWPLA